MNEPMIVSDSKVMMGKPVVAGTRITVDLLVAEDAAYLTGQILQPNCGWVMP